MPSGEDGVRCAYTRTQVRVRRFGGRVYRSLGLRKAALGFAVVLGCTAAGIAVVPSEQQMVTLERNRSLGDGTLASLVASADERTAARAALAIGRTKLKAGVPLLEPHLSDARAPVRAMAVYGLGLIADGSDAQQFITLSGSDPAGAVRIAAVDALQRDEAAGALGERESPALDAMVHALRSDADQIVRGRAAIALSSFADGPLGVSAAKDVASAWTAQRANYVRERLMWTAFRRYADRVPRAMLQQGLRDSDDVVRIEAVRAYGKLHDPHAVADLKPLLADSSWRVQEQAAESVRVLGGGKLSEHLKSVPAFVHVPARRADALASLPALPRDAAPNERPSAPNASQAVYSPKIAPVTAGDMTSPARGAHPRMRLVTTKGNLYVTLFPEWAPLTVANFINVANAGYYDGNRWFRIVPDFVVQTGDPHDNGDGDAGYTIGAEENPLEQSSYVISMGMNYDPKKNTPLRDSAGTQYYITLSPQYHLDLDFTVFGRVTSGFDVLARLAETDRVIRVERVADQLL